ncbi:EamA family transporter [Ornithinimicrobium sp. F0845]|uniref:DMT family transporter n=1 Tax=Ornithinimicrobium sp. F0845 TaxID=2926412 RepID=UPI001FF651B9|nr:EamA family transporter [Ornithinimicrobium sp. F0845]MCK0112524.1 EamA family transporter [Ornithinimicrobium sp. F0845]
MPSVTSPAAARFALRDAAALVTIAVMWGSSFFLIKVGLEDFSPGLIAWLRIVFGAAALALIPGSWQPLRHGRDWGGVIFLGVVWMSLPFVMFTLAEQHISSALAGMINGAAPLFTATFAVLLFGAALSRRLVVGLAVGFVGVVTIGLPNVDGAASLAGIAMCLLAVVCYGLSFNVSGPLQARNGALPVIWRVQLVAVVVSAPFGLPGLADATPSLESVAAVVAMGALGTGVAFAMFASLVGRVGATRASVTTYLVPAVALGLGAGLAGESVAPLSLLGVVLVLVGAYVATSRGGRSRQPEPVRQRR